MNSSLRLGFGKRSLISPVLVGREREMVVLEQALQLAASGEGRLVLLSGEAGIGKSRLLEEILHRASELWICLTGNCYEQDTAYPYSLWIDVLRRSLLGGKKELFSELPGAVRLQLSKLIPELESPDRQQGQGNQDPEEEKRRLFGAVLQFIVHFAAARPVLVELEDLHWSDEASIDMLRFVVRHMTGYPILLIVTYRSDEIRPPLASFLADIDRQPQVVELSLAALSRPEVDLMIAELLGSQAPIHLPALDPVYPLMEGNPFYIEEITHSLVEAGFLSGSGSGEAKNLENVEIPRSVQETVRKRLETLSTGARDLVTLAAIAGQQFELRLLELLTQAGPEQFLQQLRELVEARLVFEVTPETFSFRHALTRQAVISSLLGRERKALHQKVAEGIVSMYASTLDAYLPDLSYHFYAAGCWKSAQEYSEKAGKKSQALTAPRESVIHFSRAIEASRQLGEGPSVACLDSRARAYEMLGDFDRARVDFELALDTARLSKAPMDEWQATLNLGFLWLSRDYHRAGEYFQAALELARRLDDPVAMGRSLNRLGNWLLNQNQTFEARELHLQALQIFEGLHDDLGIAETLDLLDATNNLCGNIIQGVACFYRALELWEKLGNQRGKLLSLLHATLPVVIETEITPPIDPVLLREWGEICIRMAQEMDWRSAEVQAYIVLVQLSMVGEYILPFELIYKAIQISQEIGHPNNLVFCNTHLGYLFLSLLDLPAARHVLEQSREIAARIGFVPMYIRSTLLLASVFIQAEQLSEAETILNDVLTEWQPRQSTYNRMCWKVKADLALAQGHPELALEIMDRLLDTTENIQEFGRKSIPAFSMLRGDALAKLHRWEEAEAEFLAAVDVAARQNRIPLLRRILVRQGWLYLKEKKNDLAAQTFDQAKALTEQIARQVPDNQRQLFLQHALSELPSIHRPPARKEKPARPGGLSRREQEVAALIAQGKSNREIAEELYLSVRTVEAHITHILTRLGFSSRTEIAVWAAKQELE